MRMIGKFVVTAATCAAFLSPHVMAQTRADLAPVLLAQVLAQAPEAAPGLNAAIAAGDTVAIALILQANVNNPQVLAAIAQTLLGAAQALNATNPTQAAFFAAMAVSTNQLSGPSAIAAGNMVTSSPAALTLLTNLNGPNVGGAYTFVTASLVPPTNVANNSAQQCSSCN